MMHPWNSFHLIPLLEILKFWRVSPSLKYLWDGIRLALDSRWQQLGWKPAPFTHVFTALKYKHGPFSIYGPKHKKRNRLHHLLVFFGLYLTQFMTTCFKKILITSWSYVMRNMHSYSYHIKINRYCKITLLKLMILKIKTTSKPNI
jgi:hypothetical protein